MNAKIQSERISKQVTIALGASISSEIDLEGFTSFAIQMPAAFTGTELTFLACDKSDGTYQSVYTDAGVELKVTVAVSTCVSLNSIAAALAPYQWLKIRSGVVALPVNQEAARVMGMLMKA